MIALRLVHLIEGNSEKLAKGLLDKILSSERASGVRVVDRNELECGAYETSFCRAMYCGALGFERAARTAKAA